jgi:hypothetical protein
VRSAGCQADSLGQEARPAGSRQLASHTETERDTRENEGARHTHAAQGGGVYFSARSSARSNARRPGTHAGRGLARRLARSLVGGQAHAGRTHAREAGPGVRHAEGPHTNTHARSATRDIVIDGAKMGRCSIFAHGRCNRRLRGSLRPCDPPRLLEFCFIQYARILHVHAAQGLTLPFFFFF